MNQSFDIEAVTVIRGEYPSVHPYIAKPEDNDAVFYTVSRQKADSKSLLSLAGKFVLP